MKQLHPDLNGGDHSRVDELQSLIAARDGKGQNRFCLCGCGERLRLNRKYFFSLVCKFRYLRAQAPALVACCVSFVLLTGCTIPKPSAPPAPPTPTPLSSTNVVNINPVKNATVLKSQAVVTRSVSSFAIIAPPPVTSIRWHWDSPELPGWWSERQPIAPGSDRTVVWHELVYAVQATQNFHPGQIVTWQTVTQTTAFAVALPATKPQEFYRLMQYEVTP